MIGSSAEGKKKHSCVSSNEKQRNWHWLCMHRRAQTCFLTAEHLGAEDEHEAHARGCKKCASLFF